MSADVFREVFRNWPQGATYTIFVGEVVYARLSAGDGALPLVYFRRARRQLAVETLV